MSDPSSRLAALVASGTRIVVDSGELSKIKTHAPEDATTNPSLVAAAAQLPAYRALVDGARAAAGGDRGLLLDKLSVAFGCEILKLVPGVVSTEVDARLSFDTASSVARGEARRARAPPCRAAPRAPRGPPRSLPPPPAQAAA